MLGSLDAMSTDLVRTQVELDLANGKIVKLSDLTEILSENPTPPPAPAKVPLPAAITKAQKEALDQLPLLFGSVVPDTKRALTSVEMGTLLQERSTLDTVEKMAKSRKEDIRTTIVNHFDEKLEQSGKTQGAWRDADGHFVVAAHANVGDQCWSWEVREGSSGGISNLTLKDLVDDPDSGFTHKDYLACTAEVRVVDENKLLLHLKKNPHLAAVIGKAVLPKGAPVGSLYVRKAKKG